MIEAPEKKSFYAAKITARTITGTLSVPLRLLTVLGSLFIVLLILFGSLFITKFINDNYQTFQEKLKEDAELRQVLINLINTLLGLINLLQKILAFVIEIWNYIVPCLNLLAYIFYRVIIAVLLTLFGGGINGPPNDAGDTAMPLGTPDPTDTLTGGISSFLNILECILIDILSLFAGAFRVIMRALGACLAIVFEWLDENLRMDWYRREYCRKGMNEEGMRMGAFGDDWSTGTDPDSGRTTFDNGSGPGNICPDNSALIQGLIRFYEMIVNIWRDIFIFIFPIVADLLKMVFDALMKVLPKIMEGLVKIIEIFSPDQPLGKILMFLINFMIQVLGFFMRSCVLQLIISVVMCYFNVAVSIIVNAVRAVLIALAEVVCLGGSVCDPDIPGDFMDFPSCDWSSFTSCVSENYDSGTLNVQMCQVPVCSSMLKTMYQPVHKKMLAMAPKFADHEDYQIEYFKSCLATHVANTTHNEDTVEGHLFCRYLTEQVHKPVPLGLDPSISQDPYEDGQEFCSVVQDSCLCRFTSPICESQTCCLTYYSILVQQILSDLEMGETCDLFEKKKPFALSYCVSRTQRSLDLGLNDLLGSATHCDGFVSLLNQTCSGKDISTPVDIVGITGGMCGWVDKAGFCDQYRRPKQVPEGLEQIAGMYRDQLRNFKERRKGIRRVATMMGMDPADHPTSPHASTDPHHYMGHYTHMNHLLQDQYDVMFYTMSEAFPIFKSMVIQDSFSVPLGEGYAKILLDPNIHIPSGKFRNVRRKENHSWKDYNGEGIQTTLLESSQRMNWHFVGTHENIGGGYTPSSGCVATSAGDSYPNEKSFECNNERMAQTGVATGGSIEELVAPGKAQDKVDDMVANSSVPIYEKTTTRPTFQEPTNTYVEVMYNKDMEVPSNWESSDVTRDNQNPNWRDPLTRKDPGETGDRPPSFTVYGAKRPQTEIPLEACPVPTNFPWDKTFKRRSTFLTPLQAMVKQIPEWTAKNVPERPDIQVPKHIRDGVYLMYGKRKANLGKDVNTLTGAWSKSVQNVYDLADSWEKIKGKVILQKTRTNQESWWSHGLQGVPVGKNPSPVHNLLLGATQNTTDLCINRLLNPYECCTDTASAYECCFGLVGCIPPLPQLNITRLDEEQLDTILNATCGGVGSVFLSIFLIPRFIFGTWLWTLIFVSPTWLRPLLFDIFWPLVYDYGGQGIFHNVLADLFCFVVNLYYLVIIAIIILGLYIVDFVWVSLVREIMTSVEMARIDHDLSNIKESTDFRHKLTSARLDNIQKVMTGEKID